ncbi:MAG TPA: hypothetical protein DCW74_16450 [Alteromonas australica]|uniref:Uncharacterized protein n=1 Tax=Alteromonas australica TaxID=589873 RepID=A0A350P7P6_9ALTE|nr:hypothetical protein [Alteromonas australica]|tara:strand:- start:462 stop:836 length:375 start_codon:yes stop_codon:yes gene_type:complete
MATSSTTLNSPISNTKYSDTDAGAGTTATGVQISGSDETINHIVINNSVNSSKVYFKFFTSSPTVGTTAPFMVLPCEALSSAEYIFLPGILFSGGLHYACVTTAGQSGTVAPNTTGITLEVQFT